VIKLKTISYFHHLNKDISCIILKNCMIQVLTSNGSWTNLVLKVCTGCWLVGRTNLRGPSARWPIALDQMLLYPRYVNSFRGFICLFRAEKSFQVELFQGVVEGDIVSPRGPRDFGWDPCFQPKGYDLTFAEMPKVEKNKISHRALAVFNMKNHFENESK